MTRTQGTRFRRSATAGPAAAAALLLLGLIIEGAPAAAQVSPADFVPVNAPLAINDTYGPAWQVPVNILLARFVKFGAQLTW